MARRPTFDNRARIRLHERDSHLQVDEAVWPPEKVAGWETVAGDSSADGHLWRTVPAPSDEHVPDGEPQPMWEAVLRLPVAPIYGINRVHSHPFRTRRNHFHTFRVLSLGDGPPEQIDTYFLLHNGLNEVDRHTFHYRFARQLMAAVPRSACILRPFPGHLTRFPFNARFAQKPLDRYLTDSSDLFRQFLRFMIETRWLLSIVAPRGNYQIAGGAGLLAPDPAPGKSRRSSAVLADEVTAEYTSVLRASIEQYRGETFPEEIEEPPGPEVFLRSIKGVRNVLHIANDPDEVSEPQPTGDAEARQIHAVGYSLGGFVAQSVFMTWPYLVSSCSTVCSGGALRELAPTAFAHPEEWQTVMHSLRYQLDEAMMRQHISFAPDGTTAGIHHHLYGYLTRVFYEVFEQEDRGNYKTRISEYAQRLFFVVGGDDPIVRTQTVLDSAPDDGINMLEIARLTHFLGNDEKIEEIERRQRQFWLPEAARIIGGFSHDAAQSHGRDLRSGWLTPAFDEAAFDDERLGANVGPSTSLVVPVDGNLPSPSAEQVMDDFTWNVEDPATSGGWLFILRNDIPTAMLDGSTIRWRASALHHADRPAIRYMFGVHRRKRRLLNAPNLTVVLPANAGSEFRAGGSTFPPNSDATPGELPGSQATAAAWEAFHDTWIAERRDPRQRRVHYFDPGLLTEERAAEASQGRAYAAQARVVAEELLRNKDETVMDTLPDVWIWAAEPIIGTQPSGDHAIDRVLTRLALPALKQERSEIKKHLDAKDLRILKVSGAQYNPRYRGKLVTDTDDAMKLLVHASMALIYAIPAT